MKNRRNLFFFSRHFSLYTLDPMGLFAHLVALFFVFASPNQCLGGGINILKRCFPEKQLATLPHGRRRMTIGPRIPTMLGRSASGFHQPSRHCLHQARSAVRCSASRRKGELHLSKNRS